MDKQIIFKSSLNGFEKSSVLKYIDEMNSKFAVAEREYQKQIEELENEKDMLCDQTAALELAAKEQRKQLETEQAQAQEKLAAKDALIESLKDEIKTLSQKNEEQEHELTLLRAQNQLLHEQVETVEAKSKKYDEAAASIGDVILAARQDAAKITEEAHSKADMIVEEAEQRAETIISEAESKLNVTQDKMDQLKAQFFSIREQMNSSVALLNDQFGQVEASIQPLGAEAPAEEPVMRNTEEQDIVKEGKAEHPLKAILEQAATSAQKKNLFRE